MWRIGFALGWLSMAAHAGTWESKVEVLKTVITDTSVEELQSQPSLSFQSETTVGTTAPTFQIDASKTYQTMLGFGGAMTESCAMNMNRSPTQMRRQALQQLLSKTNGAGFDYFVCRLVPAIFLILCRVSIPMR